MDVPDKVSRCKCDSCAEGGCELDLTGLASKTDVLDMNCLKQALRRRGRICDCGVIWRSENKLAAVELKGGQNLAISKAVEQIQEGLNALDAMLESQSVGSFYPILLYQGHDPTASLANRRVYFRGTPRLVLAHPCGTKLNAIIGATKRRKRRRGRR